MQMDIDFCSNLPKVELHAHLGGSIRDETIVDLAKKKFRDSDENVNKILSKCTVGRGDKRSLDECFQLFDVIHKVTDNLDAIKRITKEVVQDFYSEGCTYLELRTTPREVENETKAKYIEVILRAIEEFKHESVKKDDVFDVGLILSINRQQPVSFAQENCQLAVQFKDRGVCGIDFSGNPFKGKFEDFIPSLQYGRSNGQNITLHFAEKFDEREAMQMLDFHPNRLGHACYLNQKLEERMFADRIPLEICLTSNVMSKSVESVALHHFAKFYQNDYPLVLCTDDKGVFSTSLTEEYTIAAREFQLDKQQLFNLALRSIDYTFASENIKSCLRQKMKSWKAYNILD